MPARIKHQIVDGVELKRCSHCKEWLPLDAFGQRPSAWDGLRTVCCSCRSLESKAYNAAHAEERSIAAKAYYLAHKPEIDARNKAWRDAHPEQYRAAVQAWQKAHPERVQAAKRARRVANPEKVRAADKAYREAHPEKCRAIYRAWREAHRDEERVRGRAYAEAHREELRGKRHEYYALHKDELRAKNRAWQIAHPAECCANTARRRARKRGAAGASYTTAALIQARWDYYGGRCWICGAPAEAMDHVKPLAAGGAHLPCNLRPICRRENSQKGSKWPYRRA